MFDSLFRKEAIASRNQRQQLDHLLTVTAPHERFLLIGIGLVLLAFLAWALFGSMVRSVTLGGVLIEPGARYEVVPSEPGHLVEFLVAPGDRVEAGDAIARQSVPELEREARVLRDRMALLEAEIDQVGGGGSALRSRLASARVALLQMEARRSAKELVVSRIGGEVMALRSTSGAWLPAGASIAQIRHAEGQPPRAVLRVPPSTARRIQPRMRASVEVALTDGMTHRLDGTVELVSAGPWPDWLAALSPEAVNSPWRVDVVLDRTSSLPVTDGTPCRVRIVLGRHPPVALLGLGQA